MILYFAGAVFSIWMAVDAVRRGLTVPWLWIILFFGPIGATAYLIVQYPALEMVRGRLQGRHRGRRELALAAADAERLDHVESWCSYATLLRERRRFKDAAAAARQAVERDPTHREARYELGLSLLATGEYEPALAPLEAIVDEEFAYHSGEAAFHYSEALLRTGQTEAALPILERLAEISSRPAFLYGLAAVQAELSQREAAFETLQRIIDESLHVPTFAQRETKRWVRRARRAQRKLAAA